MTTNVINYNTETEKLELELDEKLMGKLVSLAVNFLLACELAEVTTEEVIEQLLEKHEKNKVSSTP